MQQILTLQTHQRDALYDITDQVHQFVATIVLTVALRLRRHTVTLLAVASICLISCGPSPEDLVEQLQDPETQSQARQELLLAKDRAVDPLLAAMDDPDGIAGRPELVDVLASLNMRVEDPRIEATLVHHLARDKNSEVRARIARAARRMRMKDFTGPLLDAVIDDTSSQVRYEAIMGVAPQAEDLAEADAQRLRDAAKELRHDPHPGLRDEATMILEGYVSEQLEAAHTSQLKAEVARAGSLYHQAISFFPDSRHARYRYARFELDLGIRELGIDQLREHGMLLDVPRWSRAPVIDGHLDDPLWQAAARGGWFSQFVSVHKASFPSEVETDLYVGYTDEALYLGFVGHDTHPDSIQAGDHAEDGNLWWEDIVEIYVDADFDHHDYLQIGVNSKGVKADFWYPNGLRGEGKDQEWDADVNVAARVGEDRWTVELELRWKSPQMPQPQPGDLWGFNFVRVFRGSEFSQWVRTYGTSAHTPDDFGILLFE